MFESFHFRNFEPTDEIILYANTMLSQVMEVAPEDSTCLAALVKNDDRYICHFEIHSRSGKFIGETSDTDPKKAVDRMDTTMREKISKWKASRFMTEPEQSAENGFWPVKKGGRSGGINSLPA